MIPTAAMRLHPVVACDAVIDGGEVTQRVTGSLPKFAAMRRASSRVSK
jgi:hypothetical protein